MKSMDLTMRRACSEDVMLYFNWVNETSVRQQSFFSASISLTEHKKWFKKKLAHPETLMYVFETDKIPVGQVRIEIKSDFSLIGISIDEKFRGKGISSSMLQKAVKTYSKTNSTDILAYIKKNNIASLKSFLKAGFEYYKEDVINNIDSYILKKKI